MNNLLKYVFIYAGVKQIMTWGNNVLEYAQETLGLDNKESNKGEAK